MSFIVPAVLPSSRADLEEKLARFSLLPTISRVQIDVVDRHYASQASWPYTAPHELREWIAEGAMLPELDRITYEIDLMCLDPLAAIEAWLSLGASRFTLHAEGLLSIGETLRKLHTKFGGDILTVGLAMNVDTELALIEPFLDRVAYVQCMGIATIGQQGQPFDRRVLEKIRTLHTRYPTLRLQVDGGVSLATAKELLASGATDLIVGSALTRASDPAQVVAELEALSNPYA